MRQSLKRAMTGIGFRVERISDEERLLLKGYDPRHGPPESDFTYLTPANPRLIALEIAYRKRRSDDARPMHESSTWAMAESSTAEDLRYFRGDNLYLWQYTRSPVHNRYRYFIYAKYIEAADSFGLLGKSLTEDGAFGCLTFEFDGMPLLSRDLLDSVNELTFLGQNVGLFDISDCQILDIGAGYGRLAHRALTAVPNLARYWCTDAIARSTFISEYYLRHRGLSDRATVISLTDASTELGEIPARDIDIAVNIHSFSEMPFEAVQGWLRVLAELEVTRLLVVPNERDQVLSREVDGTRRDCAVLFHQAGYKLTHKEPAIRDPAVRHVLDVHDYFLLYQRA